MVEIAFGYAGLDWREYVTHSSDLLRPAEVDALRGDAAKARERLNWEPTVTIEAMLAEMVEADLARHATRLRHA